MIVSQGLLPVGHRSRWINNNNDIYNIGTYKCFHTALPLNIIFKIEFTEKRKSEDDAAFEKLTKSSSKLMAFKLTWREMKKNKHSMELRLFNRPHYDSQLFTNFTPI